MADKIYYPNLLAKIQSDGVHITVILYSGVKILTLMFRTTQQPGKAFRLDIKFKARSLGYSLDLQEQ